MTFCPTDYVGKGDDDITSTSAAAVVLISLKLVTEMEGALS